MTMEHDIVIDGLDVTQQMPKKLDFLSVALAARDRGFTWIVPVDDKAPLRRKWLKFNVTRTLSELNLMAAEFPHRDVGIVLKGHAGSTFVWDIDKEGVTERMEQETGNTLPETYVVQSRPVTAPHKRHVYFRQTEYFASKFEKQVNAGDYDLKGFGGGQVVAEGCRRKDTGEIRTGNGLAVIDVPDWLSDWLKKDAAPLVAAINAKKRDTAKTLMTRKAGDPVATGQRTLYLRNVASVLFEKGFSRRFILDGITERCRDACENGITWAASPAGKKKLKSIANDATFRRKRINSVYLPTHPQNRGLKVFGSTSTDAGRKQRFGLLVAEVTRLPSPVTATEAYKRLGLNSDIRADQLRLSRAMKAGGFAARGGQRGSRLWIRESTTQGDHTSE